MPTQETGTPRENQDSAPPEKKARRAAASATKKRAAAPPAGEDAAGSDTRAVAPDSPLYYVGIGASAGGLEALRPFVAALPRHANMTYIIAQHMSPTHRSLMVELLGRETSLKVEDATNNRVPRADTIYVAPPNSDVTVLRGKLRVSKPTNTVGPKPSVDRFLISLADDQEDHAIGIILSGTGSDGARGIKAIKAAGGISIAQEPKSAKYDSMPNNAIRFGGADLVLQPHEIAEQLQAIVQRPRPPIEEDADEAPPSTVRGIIRQIATHTGMDFSNYKDATIARQIHRRMAAIQIPNLDAYGAYISHHREELTALAGNFLICVTSFFRDPEAFEAARRTMRELLKSKRPGDEIRIWIPGCATGEEVYTMAILLAEELGSERGKYRIQLFATDINSDAVASARAGIYPEAALSGVDSTLIARYFTAHDGLYHIDQSLREMALFARQDLVQDPPFVRLDMISCRNLLIYFKPELQERVMKVFHYSLVGGAILFLGKSESIGRLSNLFAERDRKNKIFVKRAVASPIIGSFVRTRELPGRESSQGGDKPAPPSASALGHERLFEIYAPASLLMTSGGDIIEIFGECGKFLSIRKGKADFNVFSLIKTPFRAELRAYAHRVSRSKQSARCRAVEVSVEGKPERYSLAVHYAGLSDADDGDMLLVSFERADEVAASSAGDAEPGISANTRIAELEQEVMLNRENLQTVIEELETANEELQSLNEESQASNEELQASNEELETANEELQASNEELITVNDELGTRTLQLSETNTDLKNILDSVYSALIVVDRNLAVTRYNQVALNFFEIPADTKPNFASIPAHFKMPNILSHVGRVLTSGEAFEAEFSNKGKTFQFRLVPYIGGSNKDVSGVVISIVDITEKKKSEEDLKLSALVFQHASEATMITDAENRIIAVNPAFTVITGYTAEEAIGQTPTMLSSGVHTQAFYQDIWKTLSEAGHWQGEIQNRRKNGELYTEAMSINVQHDADHGVMRYIAVFRDITDVKRAQETIQRQATYDSLTGLPNRSLILDRLGQVLSASRRSRSIFAVMFLDLDHFKAINDALGHAAGDQLLVETAARIKALLRESDTVGRMGGDEFIVLLGELASVEDITPIADKLLARVNEPLTISGQTVRTAASIGITVYPMDGDTPEVILKNADSAMYEAKKMGRNTSCFFTHRMQDDANKRHWVDTELETAIAHNHLQVHYQPIIRLDTMALAGAEALMRWNHPAKGFIPPEVFIPIAEQNGMIGKLSQWIVETGLRDWSSEAHGIHPELSLSFNLSAAQFVSAEHIERILSLLGRAGSPRKHQVTVEITESFKLSDNPEYVKIFTMLNEMGCTIAVDDFGTGYSSLSYLKRIPFGIIKIDRSFVRDIVSDPTDAAMVKAILQMASAFGMETVAEGVETAEQLAFLREHGCTYGQGFLFCTPVPYAEFAEYATRAERSAAALTLNPVEP